MTWAQLLKKLADQPGTYAYVVTTEDLAFTAQLEKVGLIVHTEPVLNTPMHSVWVKLPL